MHEDLHKNLYDEYMKIHNYKSFYAKKYKLSVVDIEDAIWDAVVNVMKNINSWNYVESWLLWRYLQNNFIFRILDQLRFKKKFDNALEPYVVLASKWFDAHIESFIDCATIRQILNDPKFEYVQAITDWEKAAEIAMRTNKPRGTINPCIRNQRLKLKSLFWKKWI